MELVYLWVEEYKNIHRQGFNFSPRFRCEFKAEYEIDADGKEKLKDNCELVICDKEDTECKNKEECKEFCSEPYIKDFFGDNINVTAIVGKNGSGKSSVLNAIVNSLDISDFTYILVIRIGTTPYYLANRTIETVLDQLLPESKPQLLISLDRENNDNLPIDVGATALSEPVGSPWTHYDSINTLNQIIARILAYKIGAEDFNFELSSFMYLPNRIIIELLPPEKLIGRHIHFVARSQDRQDIENFFMSIDNSLHQLLIIVYIRKHGTEENILESIRNQDNLQNILEQDIVHQIRQLLSLLSPNEFFIDDLTNEEKRLYIQRDGYSYLLEYDFIDEKDRKYNQLSNGEKTIFGQLLSLYSNIFNQTQNKLILFDEPDLSLHPNWQKRYISEVMNLFKQNTINIHFIFTTHSPFLLSDIPKQNIIFLDTDEAGNCQVVDGLKEKKQTFGANIHTLLSDSFFMADGLMGEFAKSKINEIIEFHDKVVEESKKQPPNYSLLKTEYEEAKTKFWQTQSIIGEEYLKQVIKNHLVDIESTLYGVSIAKKEEAQRLREEADRLDPQDG